MEFRLEHPAASLPEMLTMDGGLVSVSGTVVMPRSSMK
jgi:hypothetical protein